jgi:hypothetical protein
MLTLTTEMLMSIDWDDVAVVWLEFWRSCCREV